MDNRKLSTRDLCMIGVWAAVIAVMAQISIPMPLGVPMTMQTFAITMAAVVMGSKRSGLAVLIYVILGTIGLPVFAGFTGGIQCIVRPTGGFIISFPIMAFIIGLGVDYTKNRYVLAVSVIMGTIVNYIIGLIMFCLLTGSGVNVGFSACVLPFIPTAIIKAILASLLGIKMRGRLMNMA